MNDYATAHYHRIEPNEQGVGGSWYYELENSRHEVIYEAGGFVTYGGAKEDAERTCEKLGLTLTM